MAAMRIQQVQRLVLAKKYFGVRCTLTTGSHARKALAAWYKKRRARFTCKLVKQVSKQCAGVPNSFKLYVKGPSLDASSLYYYFDSHTSGSWPTHDPCGKGQANHLKGVVNPHGNIFVR